MLYDLVVTQQNSCQAKSGEGLTVFNSEGNMAVTLSILKELLPSSWKQK